jgi:predicted nucleic acid-binding protein
MNREMTTPLIYICLDLNIWCSALIADRKGRQGTAIQTLVEIIKQGFCSLGGVQLVISWGMLNHLRLVLIRKLCIPESDVDLYISAIEGYTHLGPSGRMPQISLGGGVIALQDSEDAHVLETALAGKATILVTSNFRDFISNDTKIIVAERHAIHYSPAHTFHIVHPFLIIDWIRNGEVPPLA